MLRFVRSIGFRNLPRWPIGWSWGEAAFGGRRDDDEVDTGRGLGGAELRRRRQWRARPWPRAATSIPGSASTGRRGSTSATSPRARPSPSPRRQVVMAGPRGAVRQRQLRHHPAHRRWRARPDLLRRRGADRSDRGSAPKLTTSPCSPTERSSSSASAFGSFEAAVARLNSDGSLDTTFSGDGVATTSFGRPGVFRRPGGRDPARRRDRRRRVEAQRHRRPAGVRPRPLPARGGARPELLGRRHTDDRVRRGGCPGPGDRVAQEREDRRRAERPGRAGATTSRSPATSRRLARHRLRRHGRRLTDFAGRPGPRARDPARRQDRPRR